MLSFSLLHKKSKWSYSSWEIRNKRRMLYSHGWMQSILGPLYTEDNQARTEAQLSHCGAQAKVTPNTATDWWWKFVFRANFWWQPMVAGHNFLVLSSIQLERTVEQNTTNIYVGHIFSSMIVNVLCTSKHSELSLMQVLSSEYYFRTTTPAEPTRSEGQVIRSFPALIVINEMSFSSCKGPDCKHWKQAISKESLSS